MPRGGITITIPVGPRAADRQWLDECLASVAAQTHLPDEVLIIDDMAGLPQGMNHQQPYPIRTWHSPWRLGVAAAMNFGIALAENELVFMLCADDTLHPECLERCLAVYENQPSQGRNLAYYFVGVHYMDGRGEQFLPCGAAMVSKTLWQLCGGFPPETASGAPDAALLSILMVHPEAGSIIGIGEGMSLYNYRPHVNSDTAGRGPWQGVILETRNLLPLHWKPPAWGRYE